MMGDGDGDNISMISEADSQMSVNTAAAATRLHTVQDFCMSWQRECPLLMTSHVFWPFLTYLPTLS